MPSSAGRLTTMSLGTAVHPDPRAYVRIAGMLREMISGQVLPSGSSAPSITWLCREHGHARQTCGRAMRLLEGEGLLHRIPGLGYYVTGRECWPAAPWS